MRARGAAKSVTVHRTPLITKCSQLWISPVTRLRNTYEPQEGCVCVYTHMRMEERVYNFVQRFIYRDAWCNIVYDVKKHEPSYMFNNRDLKKQITFPFRVWWNDLAAVINDALGQCLMRWKNVPGILLKGSTQTSHTVLSAVRSNFRS